MSLINEALKKAQRLRQEEPAPGSPASESAPTERVVKRSAPKSTNTLVLLVAGGVVLIVLSVVVTVFLLNRPSDTPVTPVASSTPEAPAVTPAVTPEIRPPVIAPIEPAPAATAVPDPATPVILAAAPPEPVPVAPPLPTADPQPDPRVAAMVEAIRVAGIRSSGDESRVLMNERVYRVNDLVDRTLNVRLTKVETDTLTFSDARGVLYEKKF